MKGTPEWAGFVLAKEDARGGYYIKNNAPNLNENVDQHSRESNDDPKASSKRSPSSRLLLASPLRVSSHSPSRSSSMRFKFSALDGVRSL
jgi:hypothetical protein